MKRISFFLVILCALILSIGLNSARADGIVDIRKISSGLFSGDTLVTGTNIRFVIGLNNNTGFKCDVSNGFRISSPDGAVWDSSTIDSAQAISGGASILSAKFSVAYAFQNFIHQPGGQDTSGFLWAGKGTKATEQLPNGYNDTAVAMIVWISSAATVNDQKHICIDSSFYQPGGTWGWVGSDLSNHYPAWQDNVPGAPVYNQAGGGFCYLLYNVPNLPPKMYTGACGNAFVDPSLTGSHCSAFTYTFTACDKEGDPITYVQTAGPGTTNPATGVWSASGLATGVYTVTVHPTETAGGGAGASVNMTVTVTNAAPVLSGQCGATIVTSQSSPTPANFGATDADACDPKTFSIVSVTPPGPVVTISNAGVVSFNSPTAGDFVVVVGVSDGIVASPVTCSVTFHVLAGSLNQVVIQKVEKVIQGQFWGVNVTLKALDPTLALGGFDFLIAYDNSALSLQNVVTGALYTDCKWEYFTYRFGANGNCSGGCPSGLVRVVGLAETNNGANHPICTTPGSITTPEVMFTLNFLVSNNRLYACQYVPIRFFWVDCGDNTLSSFDGSRLILEKSVWDYSGSQAQPYQLDSNLAGFPGYAGILTGACGDTATLKPGKIAPKRDIDFYDGGIDIICAESIDARGDINLNGVDNEIADVVMFTNYFIGGLNAFGTHVNGSVAASDVNADGITLSVADLVYLIRIVVGDALPYPKDAVNPKGNLTTTVSNDNGILAVTDPMAGVALVVAGNVKPTLLANNMAMNYAFDGVNTRIVVTPDVANKSSLSGFTGNFVNVNGANVLSIDLANVNGQTVAAKLAPKSFALAQNYPNPFNPTTTISFALPTASQYTLTIYNVTGQSVAEFTGSADAGVKNIEWNASSNASGVYFYKLTAGSYTATKKMVLLK